MRSSVALLALLACLLLAAPAGAKEVTDTSGTTVATLSWTPPSDDGIAVTDLHLRIAREDAPGFDGEPGIAACATPDAGCAVPDFGAGPLTVRDLDGDGEPEVLVTLFTGGAHCCTVVRVLSWDPATGAYAGPTRDFRDAPPTLRTLAGGPALVGADARLAYAFASFASSGFPLQVTRIRDGRFVDVTRRFPGRVRTDARRWLRRYRRAVRAGENGEPQDALAAWVADQRLLGRRAAARRFLRRELRRGHLSAGTAPYKGRRFLRRLDRELRRLGY